jgi:hypothetical protein
MKHLLPFPVNIRLGWKSLLGTNTLAYYKHLYMTEEKGSIRFSQYLFLFHTLLRAAVNSMHSGLYYETFYLHPGTCTIRLFTVVIYRFL